MKILKEKGIFAFICSNKFVKTQYGKNLRKLILNYQLVIYDDLTGNKVFKEAQVDTCIIQIKKSYLTNNKIFVNQKFCIEQNNITPDSFTFKNPEIYNLREKILNQSSLIKNLEIEIDRGILTGCNNAFIINQDTKNKLISEDINNKKVIKTILRGRDISKWRINYKNLYLLYIPWDFNLSKYPSLKKYLLNFKEDLQSRPEVKNNRYPWYSLSRYAADYVEFFGKEKIVYSTISLNPCFIYDEKGYFLNNSAYFMYSEKINLKYLNAILNSNLLFWYFKDIGTDYGGKAHPYRKIYVEQLPIKITTPKLESEVVKLAEEMITLNKIFVNKLNDFYLFLENNFLIEKLSKKLEKYYELSSKEFLVEIKKRKVDTYNEKNKKILLDSFEKSVQELNLLQSKINNVDYEINKLIYKIYNLNSDEIILIESQIN